MKKRHSFKCRLLSALLAVAMVFGGVMLPAGKTQAAANTPTVSYMVHAQSFGWLDTVKNGEIGGTEGKSKRVEAIAITLDTQGLLAKDGSELTGGISYRVHAQSVGWMDPVTVEANSTSPASMVAAGKYAGTTGHGYRLEAIEISLTGAVAEEYDVIYRAHVQKIGWMGWVKNGAAAGTTGRSLRIEALQIKLLPKEKPEISATLTADSHVQNIGWTSKETLDFNKDENIVIGTTGRGYRMEAIRLSVSATGLSGGISYSAHVQGIGWQDTVGNGAIGGTEGRSKRIEAVKLNLTGELADYYDIWYRAHIQNLGWLDWTCNGEAAGSEGIYRRMEALEIKVQPKASAAPGSTTTPFVKGSIENWELIPGELSIRVNKQECVLTVYKGDVPIKAMLCSPGDPTPLGVHYTTEKFRWKELMGPSWGQYSTRFYTGMLFHSVPYNATDPYTMGPGFNLLGTRVSHGCIRLTVIDAKWIYDNCPLGTRVEIYNSDDPGPLGKPEVPHIPENQKWDPTDPAITG